MKDMKTKRLAIVALALTMLFTFLSLTLSGCGGGSADTSAQTTTETKEDKPSYLDPIVFEPPLTVDNFEDYFVVSKDSSNVFTGGAMIVKYTVRPKNQFKDLDQLPPSITVKFSMGISQFAGGGVDSYATETVTLTAENKYKVSGEVRIPVGFSSTAAYFSTKILSLSENPADLVPVTTEVTTTSVPLPEETPTT